MISNISFGSTYKVSSRNNELDKFSTFQGYASSLDSSDGVSMKLHVEPASKYPYKFSALCTLIAADSLDSKIETFCAN